MKLNAGDQIQYNNRLYKVWSVDPAGVWLEDPAIDGTTIDFIYFTTVDVENAFADGRFKLSFGAPPSSGTCNHIWKVYRGATQVDLYCDICGEKHPIDWRQIP